MIYAIFNSPIGEVTISAQEGAIAGLHIAGDRYFTEIPNSWVHEQNNALLQRAKRQLDEYFAGVRKQFELPLYFEGTPFQQAVWKALAAIKYGETATYAEIAIAIGKEKAVRAVGTAIGRNPMCILVPCHRVLASSGSFGGYVAGIACKQRLLELEEAAGAPFIISATRQ